MTAQLSLERCEELKVFITAFLTDRAHDDESKNSLTADVFRLALVGMSSKPAPVAVPECFVRFHNVIKERHYGRMPEEVQNAFDECSSMLNQRSASVAKHINEPYAYPDFDEPPLVAVPDEQYQHLSELYHAQEKRLFKIAQRIKGPSFDKYAYSPSQAIDVLEAAIFGENEEDGSTCRAAMQSFGNSEQLEPVTAAYRLRDALSPPDCWCRTCRPVTVTDMRFVVCPECGNKRCPHANDHRNACTGSNEPGQPGSAYPAAPEQEV